MLHQLREIDIVHSINVKKDPLSCITTTEEIAQDIKQFCCGTNVWLDTTINLHNIWVTDTCYHDKRVINPETGHKPILLGPTLFHMTKDDKTIGADMKKVIAKGLLPERHRINTFRRKEKTAI